MFTVLASSTSSLLRAERQAYSTSLQRRPNPDSVRFCGRIHEHAALSDQGRIARNQFDFGRRHPSTNHRITAHQTLCVGDDGLVVTRSIGQCDQEVISKSVSEHVGFANLSVRPPARSLEVPVELSRAGDTARASCAGGPRRRGCRSGSSRCPRARASSAPIEDRRHR